MGRISEPNELILMPCCKKTLAEINEKVKLGKALKAVTAVSPFLTMLGSNPIDAVFSLTTTNWDALTTATQSISVIQRKSCQKIADLHRLDHQLAGDGRIEEFWKKISESFD